MSYEELMKIIKQRRSVRSFIKDSEITDEDINKLLGAAKYVPSARNIQPIEFIVIRDKKSLNDLCKSCQQNQMAMVSVAIVIIGDILLARKVDGLSSHSATTAEKGSSLFLYMDAAAAIQNVCLAATSLGIDTVWISSFHEKEVANTLKLPETYIPLAVLPLGKRKHEPFSPPKRSIKERTHIDTFIAIDHDYSYLEASRQINEINGELKNYLDIEYNTALSMLKDAIKEGKCLKNPDTFLKHSLAVSKKCMNISKLLKKRYMHINEEELSVVGLFHDIGRCYAEDQKLHQLAGAQYLLSKGFDRIAYIVGSHSLGMELMEILCKKKVENIRQYAIDSIEKMILTFAELTTASDGSDIPYNERIEVVFNVCDNEDMKKLLLAKKETLISICEKIEHTLNQ